MKEPVHRRAQRRRRLDDLLPEQGGEDSQWLASLRGDEGAGPDEWEGGVAAAASSQLAGEVAALAERVTALEDCLVWEVAASQTARRETAELRARLDKLTRGAGEPELRPAPRRASPHQGGPRRPGHEVVDGLRASVRAAGRLLDGRRTGPR